MYAGKIYISKTIFELNVIRKELRLKIWNKIHSY